MWNVIQCFVLPSVQHTFHKATGEGLKGWHINLPYYPLLALFFKFKTVSWSSYMCETVIYPNTHLQKCCQKAVDYRIIPCAVNACSLPML